MQANIIKKQMKTRPEYRGTVMVDVNISYPQVVTPGSPVGAKISGYYSHAASSYYSYATGKLNDTAIKEYISDRKNKVPFRTYTAMMVYEVAYNQNDFLSIFTDIYEYTGGAHGNTVRHADTFNLKNGRRMLLPDLFRDSSYQNIIFSNISAQINEQIAKGENIYFDDYQKNIFKYFDASNYYLTPEGLAIFYPLYTIAPYSSGIVTFVIPYSAFGEELLYKL